MACFRSLVALATLSLAAGSVVKSPSGGSGAFELLILHNNDMHARFEQTSQLSGACTAADRDAGKCYGGFPRVAHVVKEARKAAASGEGPPVLYLNAGDTYTGTAWFTIYKWKIAAEFLNALRPDAVSLDNNEINLDTHEVTPFIENITPTIIASNVILNKPIGNHAIEKSVTFDINGVTVGVVGYLKPDSRILEEVEYIDEVIAVTEEVQILKHAGVNIIIALGHSDTEKNMEIARDVEGLDLVIAGQRNFFFSNGNEENAETVIATQSTGKKVPVIQSQAYKKYLGQVKLSFVQDGDIFSYENMPILLDNTVPLDSEALQLVKKHREVLSRNSEEVIGVTSVVLDGSTCGLEECNFGNLIADAMMYTHAIKFEGENWTDAPIAVIPAGSILGSISPANRPANVTIGDLLSVLPSEGNMVTVTTNGAVLLQLLEQSVINYNPQIANGGFLQFSGIRVVYDMSLEPGSRIVSAIARCGTCFVPEFYAIDDWRTYTILMPSTLAQGGYGYEFLADLERVDLDYDEATCVSEFLGLRSPVYPEVANRITVLNVDAIDIETTTTDPVTETMPPPDTDSALALSCTVTVLLVTLLSCIVV